MENFTSSSRSSDFEMKPTRYRTQQSQRTKTSVHEELAEDEDEEVQNNGFQGDDTSQQLLLGTRGSLESEDATRSTCRRQSVHSEIQVEDKQESDQDHGGDWLFEQSCFGSQDKRETGRYHGGMKVPGRCSCGITQRNFVYAAFLLLGAGFLFPFDRFGDFIYVSLLSSPLRV